MPHSPVQDGLPHVTLSEAVRMEVGRLADRHGLDCWLVTRRVGAEAVVLCAHGPCCGPRSAVGGHGVRALDAEVALGGRSLVLGDVAGTRGSLRHCPDRPGDVRAYLGVPLRSRSGELIGVLSGVGTERPHADLAAEQVALEGTARLLATMIDAEEAITRETYRAALAEREAHSDHATRLPNRRSWQLVLEREERRCRREGRPAAVAYIDVDGLKQVNDDLGHAEGDRLLERTAQALLTAVRGGDVVARLGGDEFGVLLPDCDAEGIDRALARIRAALALAGVSASVGVASRPPTGTLSDAVRLADLEMYGQKRDRRSGWAAAERRRR